MRSAASASGRTARNTVSRSASGSTGIPASRRISRPRAWNVRTATAPAAIPSGSSAASSRSVISSAARLLKVIARMAFVGVPPSTSHATRATSVVVLPLPAGATHRIGPDGAVAAARWSGARRARRFSTSGCMRPMVARGASPRDYPAPRRTAFRAVRQKREFALTTALTKRYRRSPLLSGVVWRRPPAVLGQLRCPNDRVPRLSWRCPVTRRSRLIRPIVLLTLLTLLFSAAAAPTSAAPPPKQNPAGSADRVVMFASDGMRPDLMKKYAADGVMPTYKALMDAGVTGDNGMTQAFPPNTGVGWYTMATGAYPADHGSTNNTYFRAGDAFNNRTSFSAAGVLQADTIANAAERAGKKVAQIDWVGGAASGSVGPTVDFTNFFTNRGVLVGAADPVEQAGSQFFGVTTRTRRSPPATGWTDVPSRRSGGAADGRRRGLVPTVRSFGSAVTTPPTTARTQRTTTSTSMTAWSAAGSRTTTRSSARSARPARAPSVDLAVGDFLAIKLTGGNGLIGPRAGQTVGHYVKLISITPDASQFKLYLTLADAGDRPLRHGRATDCRPAAPAKTGSRSTSPTTSCRGRPATSRRSRRASSTRTPTSSRVATSSGPTASRSSTTSSGPSSPIPTSPWSATRSRTRSRTSSWPSCRRPTRTATRTRATTSSRSSTTSSAPAPERPVASPRARSTSAAPTRTPTRSSASRASLMGGNPTTSRAPTTASRRPYYAVNANTVLNQTRR